MAILQIRGKEDTEINRNMRCIEIKGIEDGG